MATGCSAMLVPSKRKGANGHDIGGPDSAAEKEVEFELSVSPFTFLLALSLY